MNTTLDLTFKSNGRVTRHSVRLLAALDLKWCSGCKIPLPKTNFSNDRSAPDRLNYYCKPCAVDRVTARRIDNIHNRWDHAKRLALKSHHDWTILEDEYALLMKMPCVYCGCPLNLQGIGLDRINNTEEYTSGNVLSACNECNVARSDHFSPVEMITTIGPAIRLVKLARKE